MNQRKKKMGLNKQRGNMYKFVTHTWNAIKGRCSHDCIYCYMKRWGHLKQIRLDETEFKTDLGAGNYIFVGSSTDMWAEDIPDEWIYKTLEHCRKFDNTYLFQSKNPKRFNHFPNQFPPKTVLGTTIETNRQYKVSKAPEVKERAKWIRRMKYYGFKTMVTIEPIMDFDLEDVCKLIKSCQADWINIGADSQGHKLPEPNAEKLLNLILDLQQITKIHCKYNLRKILTLYVISSINKY